MAFRPPCMKWSEGKLCLNRRQRLAGLQYTRDTYLVDDQGSQKHRRGASAEKVLLVIFIAVLTIGGASMLLFQPHSNQGTRVGCASNSMTVYVGYVQTLNETVKITQEQRIVNYSYEKASECSCSLSYYNVYLRNDRGQQLEYDNVVQFEFNPTAILIGC